MFLKKYKSLFPVNKHHATSSSRALEPSLMNEGLDASTDASTRRQKVQKLSFSVAELEVQKPHASHWPSVWEQCFINSNNSPTNSTAIFYYTIGEPHKMILSLWTSIYLIDKKLNPLQLQIYVSLKFINWTRRQNLIHEKSTPSLWAKLSFEKRFKATSSWKKKNSFHWMRLNKKFLKIIAGRGRSIFALQVPVQELFGHFLNVSRFRILLTCRTRFSLPK